MPPEPTGTPPVGQVPPVTPPVPPPPVTTPPPAEPGPVPYDRFKQVNDKANLLEQRLAQLETSQRITEEQKLVEQKKWEELAKQRETELKTERTERLRLEVATAKGLPVGLAGRLQGDDKAAMEKDADMILVQIAEAAKGRQGPGVPPPPQGGRPVQTDLSKMTPEEIRKQTPAILNQTRS